LQLHQIVFLGLWLGSSVYAGVRGGAPERMVAAALLCAGVLTNVLGVLLRPAAGDYASFEVGVALTDLAVFVAITAIAMTSTRFWPMLQAGMMGCDVFGHLAKPLGPDILPEAYYATVAIWGYPMLIVLVVATWRHQVRLARYGVDYAWVRDLPRRYRNGWSIDELARPLPHN
jgi:hypothetical protein